MLAGSAAYAIGEALGWPVGLDRKPLRGQGLLRDDRRRPRLVGRALNFTPINPIKALFWSAVINGVVAVPVMAVMMLLSTKPRSWGASPSTARCGFMGWLATAAMAAAAVAMGVGLLGAG